MLKRLDRVASEAHGALHREAIGDPASVHSVLTRMESSGVVLKAGIGRRNTARSATVLAVDANGVWLSTTNLDVDPGREIYFNFELDGAQYFFAGRVSDCKPANSLRIDVPTEIYRAERRDAARRAPSDDSKSPGWITIHSGARAFRARVVNETIHGIAVAVPSYAASALSKRIVLRSESAPEHPQFGLIRHHTRSEIPGYTTLGLSISSVPHQDPISIERRDRILASGSLLNDVRSLVRHGVRDFANRLVRSKEATVEIDLRELANQLGQPIREIVNSCGSDANAIIVVIPPAWGKTKETMLPLALTLVESFSRAGKAIRVVRFDGTNRRGESFIDPECRRFGDEYLSFTFSQAARDLEAVVAHQASQCPGRPIIVITFSLAAVETRHALARDRGLVAGWISVVGMADLQSALRSISGGVDYGYGLINGVRFGRHELVGVVADMDRTGLDAIENNIGFLEDVRRDMAQIRIPITWIHGKYDAWMDLDRVVEIMSCGRLDNRKLIEVPTGHELRTSRVALETFRLISEEVAEMALGERVVGAIPSPRVMRRYRAAELSRLSPVTEDLRALWKDYLLGRDRTLGMEFLTATASYRNFMERQIGLLRIQRGETVIDLGSGIGEFSASLGGRSEFTDCRVVEADYIREALERARSRRPVRSAVQVSQMEADLDLSENRSIPIGNNSIDAALASLVISYVSNPDQLLAEIHRVLRSGGRIVVSSMAKDADVSLLYRDGLVEFATPEARRAVAGSSEGDFDRMVQEFLNDGSRVLALEERGKFRFWDEDELRVALTDAGFRHVSSEVALGDPPQAVVVSGVRG